LNGEKLVSHRGEKIAMTEQFKLGVHPPSTAMERLPASFA
jgi:hypothetical protein